MLTADMVHARRQKGMLKLKLLDKESQQRALTLARRYHEAAEIHLGESRQDLSDAWATIDLHPKDRKLGEGLMKLIEDKLTFEMGCKVDPILVRRTVFERSTAYRRELGPEEHFDRDAVLAEAAITLELTAEEVEEGLFSDLKAAHRMVAMEAAAPEVLVRGYDMEQAKAVLLRAVKVSAVVEGASVADLRVLFRKLKFLRLLHTIERQGKTVLIELTGPFSLFESVTKYGLSLALALPALTACGKWALRADIRWGKKRDPLVFELKGKPQGQAGPTALPQEVQTLLDRFAKRKTPWQVEMADEILELPGSGLTIPDLRFTHEKTGESILLEVMGFWSRDAVFNRVELVEAGLRQKVLFAVSKRLRVSEEVLGDDLPSALYVYKGALNPKDIEAKLELLSER